MAYTTDTQLLADVNDAIDALVTGRVEEYSLGSRRVRYADLRNLREFRAELERRISMATTGGVGLVNFGRAV